ncbi:MAG: ATP-binding cassette domain-containing protein [Crocinitomicaceae bacterium]|nr:ATP-binding cassette domain-containing protein [Crocinitomicaceae bacterium]
MISETNTPPTPGQRFWRLLAPDRKEITNIYIYAVFNGLVYLSLPLGIQAIINLIQGGRISTSWVLLVSFVIAGIAAMGVLQILQLRITEVLQQKIFTRAAFEFAYRLPRIKLEALYRHYAPELMNRFFDTISIQKGLSKILIDFSAAIVQVVFGLLVLSFYHPFFIFFSLFLIIVIYFIFSLTVKRGLATSMEESKFKYKVVHWLQEVARTNSTFKLAGTTDLPLTNTNKEVEGYLVARENHFKILVKQYGILVAFKVLIATGLLAMGGILVMEQELNIGQFVAAEIIILLIMASVEKLVLNMEVIYDVLTSLEKIGQVTDLELEKNQGLSIEENCETSGLSVQLEDVSFKYPGNTKFTLQELNLNINPGERLLISGKNSSGKNTLSALLAGLYDVTSGHISYNGLPKGNLELQSLRDLVGAGLIEEQQVFSGTILENIAMGRKNATFENVKWAVANLGLENFIRQSKAGYETMLDPTGMKLSKSTVQKLMLARSIADKPKLLILNQSFSAIEQSERLKIEEFILDRSNPWTLAVIGLSHELAQKTDKIIILEQGKIIHSGTYDQLKNHLSINPDNHA